MEISKPKRTPLIVDAKKVLLTEHTYGINHKLALHQKFAERYNNNNIQSDLIIDSNDSKSFKSTYKEINKMGSKHLTDKNKEQHELDVLEQLGVKPKPIKLNYKVLMQKRKDEKETMQTAIKNGESVHAKAASSKIRHGTSIYTGTGARMGKGLKNKFENTNTAVTKMPKSFAASKKSFSLAKQFKEFNNRR